MSGRKQISNSFTVSTIDDPVSVVAQYAPNDTPTASQIHDTWQTGDLYMRTKSTEAGATWSTWQRIVGESGGETNYMFALSANKVSQDGTSATAPTDIASNAWQDAPMATTTQKPYLWSKVQKKDGSGNNVGNPSYIRMTGEKGDSAFIADLDNEMTNAALDDSGNLMSALSIWVKPRAYYGTSEKTSECTITASCTDNDITVDYSAATTTGIHLTASQGAGLAATTDVTIVVAHATYGTRTLVFTIAGVRGGANALLREILPSLNVISFARQPDGSLTPASRNLSLSIKKTQGNSTSIETISESGLTVRWSTSGMPPSSTDGNAWGSGTSVTGITWNSGTMQIVNSVAVTNIYIAAFNSGGTLVDRETIPVIKDGANGTSPYLADLDNEMDAVQCTHNGKVIASQSVSTTVSMWKGSSVESFVIDNIYRNGTQLTWGSASSGVTPTKSGSTVTIAFSTSASIADVDDFKITIRSSNDSTVTRELHLKVNGVRANAIYRLIPSHSQIVKKKNNTYEPSVNITCSVEKVENGTTSTPSSSEYTLEKSVNGGNYETYSATTPSSITTDLKFRLKVDNVVVDLETIPLVTDGTDGADGEDGEDGQDGDSIFQVQAFKYFASTPSSSDKPTKTTNIWQSTTDFGNGWYNRPTKQAGTGLSSVDYGEVAGWLANGVVTIPSPGDSGINIGTIYFTTSQSNVDVEIEITSSSEANYDFGAIGKLDTTSLSGATASSIKSDSGTICSGKVSGDGTTLLVTLSVASAGRHSVQIAYAKDSSQSSFNDNAVVQVMTSVDSPNDLAYCCMATVVNGTVSGSWSSPIPWQGDKGDGAKYIYLRGTGNNNPMSALFTSFNGTTANNVQITSRGLTLLLVNRSDLSVYSQTSYDVYGDGESTGIPQCNALATAINNASSAYFVCIVSFDAVRWNDNLVNALKSCGSSGVEDQTPYRVPFAFIGYKGLGEGYAMQVQSGQGSTDAPAEITSYVANGALATTKSGQRGKVGRFFYYSGTFDGSDSTTTFIVSDAQAPYFYYNNNYWVYNPETNPSGGSTTMSAMGTPSSSSDDWEIMTNDFKYLITEAIFGQYAHFGSFIINGDWMISQHGVIYDTSGGIHTIDDNSSYSGYTYQNAYTLFDPDYPNSSKPSANNFVPNYAVDGKTGNTYQNEAYVRGEIHASSGKIGGFSIGAKELTNNDWQAGIDIEANSKVVKIGENAKGVMETENAIMRVENTATGGSYNTALYIKTTGASYNYAFYGEGNGVLNGLILGYKLNEIGITGTTDTSKYVELKNGAIVMLTGSRTYGTVTLYMPKLSQVRAALGISSTSTKFAIEMCFTRQTSESVNDGNVNLRFRSTSESSSEYPYRYNFNNNYTGNNYTLPMGNGDFARVLLIWDGSNYKAFVTRYITGDWY